MNRVIRAILEAVREGKVTPQTRTSAAHLLDKEHRREAAAAARACTTAHVAKKAIASVEHHKKARRSQERAVDAAEAAAYKAVARRDRRCTVQLPAEIVGPCAGPLQIDHQWGRGKEPTKVENCRRLCERHHRMKTDSKPSRLVWLYDFAEHCLELAGLEPEYMNEVDRAQRAAQLEKAQHGRTI